MTDPRDWYICLHLVHFSMVNVENNRNYILYLDPMGPTYSWLLHLKSAHRTFMPQTTQQGTVSKPVMSRAGVTSNLGSVCFNRRAEER